MKKKIQHESTNEEKNMKITTINKQHTENKHKNKERKIKKDKKKDKEMFRDKKHQHIEHNAI